MSGPGDYPGEMDEPVLDDAAAEALLQGRSPADPELAGVAAFLRDLRGSAARPAPPMSPALAALLREGAPAPARVPAPVAAPVPQPAPTRGRLRAWRRWAAVAGIGTGVALTGVVGAGAAGLLPAPAERVVEEAVETLTPLQLPKPRTDAQIRERERARTGTLPTPTGPRGTEGGEAPEQSSTTAPTTVVAGPPSSTTSTSSAPDVTTPAVTAVPTTTTSTVPATTSTTRPGLPNVPLPTLPGITLPDSLPLPPVTAPRLPW